LKLSFAFLAGDLTILFLSKEAWNITCSMIIWKMAEESIWKVICPGILILSSGQSLELFVRLILLPILKPSDMIKTTFLWPGNTIKMTPGLLLYYLILKLPLNYFILLIALIPISLSESIIAMDIFARLLLLLHFPLLKKENSALMIW